VRSKGSTQRIASRSSPLASDAAIIAITIQARELGIPSSVLSSSKPPEGENRNGDSKLLDGRCTKVHCGPGKHCVHRAHRSGGKESGVRHISRLIAEVFPLKSKVSRVSLTPSRAGAITEVSFDATIESASTWLAWGMMLAVAKCAAVFVVRCGAGLKHWPYCLNTAVASRGCAKTTVAILSVPPDTNIVGSTQRLSCAPRSSKY